MKYNFGIYNPMTGTVISSTYWTVVNRLKQKPAMMTTMIFQRLHPTIRIVTTTAIQVVI